MFRPINRGSAFAVALRVGVPTLACVVLAASPRATQQAPAPQPPQDQPARPTFRLGASYVRVDVYPTRNGEPVPDLDRADLELLEDGVPQTIEQFERISLQTTTDRESRRDPNTVAESREQAADPRRRVFVVFLDTGMTTIEGSHAARRPIVDMLDRLIGQDDMFAVMTPDMSANGITFARRTESLDAELARYWTWGQRDALVRLDPEETLLEACFPDPAPEKYCPGPDGKKLIKQPADAYRGIAAQLIERRSEERALSALDDLVSELGALREERKAVIVVSQGWRLLEPKPQLVRLQECDQAPLPGRPGVSPGGRVVGDVGAARTISDVSPGAQCHAMANQYANADNASRFRQLVERANRFNVSFYPFDTRGLAVFDRSIGARDDRIRDDPGERSEKGRGARGPLTSDMDRLVNRVESLRTLADATDGLAVVNTNDLAGGARRIVNDLSTYYLLGYQSTNTKLDGRWRVIKVRVKTPGVQVRARKGYRALTEAEAALLRSGDAPPVPGTPAAAGQRVELTGAAAVSRVIEPLAGLDRTLAWRSRTAWSSGSSPGRTRFWIASEIDDTTLRQPEWASGGTGTATLARSDGQRLADVTLKLEPGSRVLEASLDAEIPASTEVMIRLRLSPAGGGLPLSDTLRVTPSGASARLFRRGPTTGRQFVAAGAPRFRRTEYARVALPIEDASSTIEAALIDRTGVQLRIPVASRVETIDGTPWALGEVSLAPLSPGDYVLRLMVGQGAGAVTSLTAIRIVN